MCSDSPILPCREDSHAVGRQNSCWDAGRHPFPRRRFPEVAVDGYAKPIPGFFAAYSYQRSGAAPHV